MFEAVTKLAPDIFVFLGDNIYGDTEDMELLLKKWNELGDIESFLLKKLKANHTFAISGDVHFAELSKLEFQGYPFYDLTGSGMTNTSKDWASAKNSFRVGESYPVQNAGLIEIDWANKSVELAIINKDGEKILNQPLKFSALEFE